MATSGKITGSCTGEYGSRYDFWAEWQRNGAPDSVGNSSNVTVNLKIQRNVTWVSAYNLDKKPTVELTIKGGVVSPTRSYIDTRDGKISVFATWTGTVFHDADGTLRLPIAATFTHYGSSSLTGGSLSGVAELEAITRATVAVLSDVNPVIGNEITITLNPAEKGFLHKLSYHFGNVSEVIADSVATKAVWPLPMSMIWQMPNSPFMTGYVICETYMGEELIGTRYSYFTAYIPDSDELEPKISMVLTPYSSLPAAFEGLYLMEKSRVRADFTASEGQYGATITLCELIINGTKRTGSVALSELLSVPGECEVIGRVTDGRGRTAETRQTITVAAYRKPYVTPYSGALDVTCVRCQSDGSVDPAGSFLKIEAGRSYTPVGDGLNRCALRLRYMAEGAPAYSEWYTFHNEDAEKDLVSTVFSAVVFDRSTSYAIQLGAVDTIGESTEITRGIPADFCTIHEGIGGRNVAIGMYCDYSEKDRIDMGWKTYFHGDATFLREGARYPMAGYYEYDESIWRVRRWLDGSVELWGRYTATVDIKTAWVSNVMYYAPDAIPAQPFPVTFKDVPFIQVTPSSVGNAYILCTGSSGSVPSTTSTGNWQVCSPYGRNDQKIDVSFYVRGTIAT